MVLQTEKAAIGIWAEVAVVLQAEVTIAEEETIFLHEEDEEATIQ